MKHVDMQGDAQIGGTAPKEINTNGAGTPCSATGFPPLQWRGPLMPKSALPARMIGKGLTTTKSKGDYDDKQG